MKKYIFPLLLLGLASCGSDNSSENKTEDKKVIVKHFKNEAEMDAHVLELKKITESADLLANSLHYEKGEEGIMIEVIGHLDSATVLQILEEQFSDGNGKSNGKRFYYLNNGLPFVTQELIDYVDGANEAVFIDRVSYYDEKGKIIKTKERRASFEDDINNMSYKAAPLQPISMNRAMAALKSEKEFATTFQGFVHQDIFSYLIVGPNDPNGFTSALRLDYKDELINTLSGNEDMYMGSTLQVKFEIHTDRGFRFQVYAGGKLVD
ncbi:hypothetical protein [Fluviicola taffensis]|uniref:hypothetical protein n=1 Tax=Fluviicola taffensis TaxID=191579 RepID=UPI00313844F9